MSRKLKSDNWQMMIIHQVMTVAMTVQNKQCYVIDKKKQSDVTIRWNRQMNRTNLWRKKKWQFYSFLSSSSFHFVFFFFYFDLFSIAKGDRKRKEKKKRRTTLTRWSHNSFVHCNFSENVNLFIFIIFTTLFWEYCSVGFSILFHWNSIAVVVVLNTSGRELFEIKKIKNKINT